MKKQKNHKPIIETMINTSALALTATGTNFLMGENSFGFLLVLFGATLEFYKYWGRKKELL